MSLFVLFLGLLFDVLRYLGLPLLAILLFHLLFVLFHLLFGHSLEAHTFALFLALLITILTIVVFIFRVLAVLVSVLL